MVIYPPYRSYRYIFGGIYGGCGDSLSMGLLEIVCRPPGSWWPSPLAVYSTYSVDANVGIVFVFQMLLGLNSVSGTGWIIGGEWRGSGIITCR